MFLCQLASDMHLLEKTDPVCQPVVFHSMINALSMARTVSFENINTLSACFVFQAIVVKGYYRPPEFRALFNHKHIMGNTMRSNCWRVGNDTLRSICQGARGSRWARCYFGRTFGNIAARGFSCCTWREQSVPFLECSSRGQDTDPPHWKRPLQTLCAVILRITLKLSRPPPRCGLCNSLCPSTQETSPGPHRHRRQNPAGAEPDCESVPHQCRTTGLQSVKYPTDHRRVSRLLSTQASWIWVTSFRKLVKN